MLNIAASNIFTNYIRVYILAYLKSPKDVGIYNIAFKIATVTSFFLVSINSIVAPKFAELYWSNRTKELKKTVLKSAKLNFWSSTPVLLPFIFFPKFFMGLFGIEFVEGYRSLIILSIGQFVNAFCGSVGYLLTMTGNQDVFRNIYFISTILNLLLCFILIPLLGVDGAALSFSISMIFWNVLSLIIVKKKFGFVTYYLPFLKNE
jgi:O-antigen/teichoic acid export membrane protein